MDAENEPALQRRVSLMLIGIPLGMAVQAIADRAGLEVTFSPETIPFGARVSMHADDVTVAAALRWVLVNARVDVLIQNDTHLTLVPRATLAAVDSSSSGTLAGDLMDGQTGEPVPYGTVTLLGTEFARFTDRAGHFRLARVPTRRYVVRARQIGYSPVDSTISIARDSTTRLTIRMHRVPAMLNLVRVTGHRTQGCVATGIPDSTVDPALARVFAQIRENVDRYDLLLEKYPFRFVRDEGELTRHTGFNTFVDAVDTAAYESTDRRPYRVGNLIFRDSLVEQDSVFRDIAGRTHITRAECPAYYAPTTPSSSPGCFFVGFRTRVTRRRRLMELPTFADLVEPAFLKAHCFEYAGTTGPNGSAGLIRVNFAPAKSIKTPDVSGSVYLDADSLIIRRAVFGMTRPEAADPPITGFRVSTTFREILPLVPIIDSVESVQPGGGATMALGWQRLIGFTFEGPTPGEETAGPPELATGADPRPSDSALANPAVANPVLVNPVDANSARAATSPTVVVDAGATRVRAVFPANESCKPTPAVDTISVLLYATLHGRRPRGVSDSAWSIYTGDVLNTMSQTFVLPDTLSLSTFSWPFEHAVRKENAGGYPAVADLNAPEPRPTAVPPIDSSKPRSGTLAVLVLDDLGDPVPFAGVRLAGTTERGRTDSIGFVRMRRLRPGAYLLEVRRIGYAAQDTIIAVSSGGAVTSDTIHTARAAARLAVVTVQGRNTGPFVTPMISSAVTLTLGADGLFRGARLDASSTSSIIDQLVLAAVQSSGAAHAFPRLPGGSDPDKTIEAHLVVSMEEPAPGEQAVALGRLDAPAWPSSGPAQLAKMSSVPADVLSDLAVGSDTAAIEFVVSDRGDPLLPTVRLDYSSPQSLAADTRKQADRERYVRHLVQVLRDFRFDAGRVAGCHVPEFMRQAFGYNLHY